MSCCPSDYSKHCCRFTIQRCMAAHMPRIFASSTAQANSAHAMHLSSCNAPDCKNCCRFQAQRCMAVHMPRVCACTGLAVYGVGQVTLKFKNAPAMHLPCDGLHTLLARGFKHEGAWQLKCHTRLPPNTGQVSRFRAINNAPSRPKSTCHAPVFPPCTGLATPTALGLKGHGGSYATHMLPQTLQMFGSSGC